jgi:hypothetical protein
MNLGHKGGDCRVISEVVPLVVLAFRETEQSRETKFGVAYILENVES